MTVTVKETPGGTPIETRTLGNGNRVQAVDAAPPPRTYFAGHQVIDLNNNPTVAKVLTIPTGARFATGRLFGTADTDQSNFLFVDVPTISDGEPIFQKEEIDISDPVHFAIIKAVAASGVVGGAVGTGLKFIVQYWDTAL